MENNVMVKFDYSTIPIEYHEEYKKLFKEDDIFIYLGDIKQMPGHCILCNFKTNKMLCGYHTDNFIELTEEEV